MAMVTLSTAFRRAYDAVVDDCSDGVAVDRGQLRDMMVVYVEKECAELIRMETHWMLTRAAEAYIKKRHHGSRPSAASIQRAVAVASDVQAVLPTFESVLREMYDLPDGRSIALGSMSINDLRAVVAIRRKQLDEDRAILGRLELMLGEAERRGVQTVRQLLAA